MFTVSREELPHRKVKLTVTLPKEDMQPHLEEAAKKLTVDHPIEGFRPGFAPLNIVIARVGAMPVYESAVESMVRSTYPKVLLQENLSPVGSPEVSVKTLAPDNDFVYEAVVSLMPTVQKIADWKNTKLKKEPVAVTDKHIDKVIDDLRRMRTAEVRATADEAATKEDKLIIDLTIKKDQVPLEGGVAKRSSLHLNEEGYLPGLVEAVLGMKEGETRTFVLTMPKDHYNKAVAGAAVDVEVIAHELYHLQPPVLDDAFATSVGTKDLADLRARINENLGTEKEAQERERQERNMLETLAKQSAFDEIPDMLVQDELQKMIGELREHITRQGMEFQQYLEALKKTPAELIEEMRPQALLRLQIALLLKAVAEEEKVEPTKEEVDAEIDLIGKDIKDAETRERVYSPEFRQYQTTILRNRKTIELLRAAIYA